MEIEIIKVLGFVVQFVGFIAFARFGAVLGDKLDKKSRWLALGIAVSAILISGIIAYFAGLPLAYYPQTAAVFCLGFGGGIVARIRARIEEECDNKPNE